MSTSEHAPHDRCGLGGVAWITGRGSCRVGTGGVGGRAGGGRTRGLGSGGGGGLGSTGGGGSSVGGSGSGVKSTGVSDVTVGMGTADCGMVPFFRGGSGLGSECWSVYVAAR